MREVGRVGNVKNNIAEIFIDTFGCENCDLKDHCITKMKSSLKAYTNNITLLPGDKVEVEVPNLVSLKASLIVYGIPFGFFLTGFFIGYVFSETMGLVGGLIGLGTSFLVSKKAGNSFIKKSLPKIIKKSHITI